MKQLENEQDSKRHRLRISDVARHCNLSKATVSKALSLPPEQCPLSAATRQRVLDAVAELGYRPSWQARALATRRTHMIAIAYAASSGAVPRGVYWEVVDFLERFLDEFGLSPIFIHADKNTEQMGDSLSDGRFDGCIALGSLAPVVLDVLKREKVPTVLVNADVDADWNRVNVNDEMGTELVMKHLIGLGHRKIAYNAGRHANPHSSAIIRAATYARCMREAGLEPTKPFIGPVDKLVAEIIEGPYKPTALLDFEHWTAVHVLQQMWRRGLRVPDDLSVAAFNDTYPVHVVIPPLTTVALPSEAISRNAVDMLIAQIQDMEAPRRRVLLDEKLVIRESTAPPRVRQ